MFDIPSFFLQKKRVSLVTTKDIKTFCLNKLPGNSTQFSIVSLHNTDTSGFILTLIQFFWASFKLRKVSCVYNYLHDITFSTCENYLIGQSLIGSVVIIYRQSEIGVKEHHLLILLEIPCASKNGFVYSIHCLSVYYSVLEQVNYFWILNMIHSRIPQAYFYPLLFM